jgi:parvulin-like peptidyl-prolyl isomerase
LVAVSLAVLSWFVFRDAGTDPLVAKLGDVAIHERDFTQYLASIQSPEHVAVLLRDAAARDEAFEEYLDVRALEEKAKRDGLDRDPRFVHAVQLMESRTLAHLELERFRSQFEKAAKVSEQDVEAYYEQHVGEFRSEPRFTAHHLLVYARGNPAFPERGLPKPQAHAKAKEALSKLRRGGSWEEIALRYSDDLATKERAGLLRDRQFGYFAQAVEQALRTQPLHRPSDVLETEFGYYVVQVEERVGEPVVRPFDEVRQDIEERLAARRADEVRFAILAPLRQQIGFEITEVGLREAPLFDERAIGPQEILASVDGKAIRQSDFSWFCRDALLPHQRTGADARPGARRGFLETYLDQLVLAATAKREGRDRSAEYLRRRTEQLVQLRAEFLREREPDVSARERHKSEAERQRSERTFLDRVRREVGLERLQERSQPRVEAPYRG